MGYLYNENLLERRHMLHQNRPSYFQDSAEIWNAVFILWRESRIRLVLVTDVFPKSCANLEIFKELKWWACYLKKTWNEFFCIKIYLVSKTTSECVFILSKVCSVELLLCGLRYYAVLWNTKPYITKACCNLEIIRKVNCTEILGKRALMLYRKIMLLKT